MLVSEVLLKKLYAEDKCRELKDYLVNKIPHMEGPNKNKIYSDYLSKYFGVLDELRTYKVCLNQINKDRTITIGTSVVPVTDALKLAENLEMKVEVLTNIIQSDEFVGISNFMDERDKLINEYLAVVKAIKRDDWNVEVD